MPEQLHDPVQSCDIEVRVRYSEVDSMSYLHHARYFNFFEMGRTELLRHNGVRYRDMEERGLFFAVVKLECRFRAPAYYDDVLTITTISERLTRVRVDHRYELKRDGRLLAEAKSTVALVDRSGKPTIMPDDFYYVITGQAPRPTAVG